MCGKHGHFWDVHCEMHAPPSVQEIVMYWDNDINFIDEMISREVTKRRSNEPYNKELLLSCAPGPPKTAPPSDESELKEQKLGGGGGGSSAAFQFGSDVFNPKLSQAEQDALRTRELESQPQQGTNESTSSSSQLPSTTEAETSGPTEETSGTMEIAMDIISDLRRKNEGDEQTLGLLRYFENAVTTGKIPCSEVVNCLLSPIHGADQEVKQRREMEAA